MVAAARALVAEEGMVGLTMRTLAQRLDVAPNALYSHVANKTALVDLVLDDVLADIAVPEMRRRTTDEARDALRTVMTTTFDVLVRHCDLLPAFVERRGSRGPNARRLGEAMAPMLERLGHTDEEVREVIPILVVHAIAFAAFAAPTSAVAEMGPLGPTELRRSYVRSLDWLLTGMQTDLLL